MRGLASINLTTLTDDDRFLIQSFFTPALSFGVVDLEKRKYVGEIETGGCAHTMAAGPRRFLSLCGDGAVLAVDLDDNGAESARTSHPGFFDAEGESPPSHGREVRGRVVLRLGARRDARRRHERRRDPVPGTVELQ